MVKNNTQVEYLDSIGSLQSERSDLIEKYVIKPRHNIFIERDNDLSISRYHSAREEAPSMISNSRFE